MNLFQLQERLKNFSQDQLVNEMRNPSGSAPQYLVLSELQRRRRIMQEEQAQMPQQASVAEEAVAAAGMPQGGLAQMAQAMAPQTDMTQNTARMADGGEVRRMDVGGRATGLAAINRNLADFMPMRRGARGNRFMNLTPDAMGAGIAVDALMADPRVQAAATSSNMSLEEYISALNSEQFQTALDMLNTPVENAPMRDEGRISDEEFMASRYDGPGGAYSVTERSGVPGRARLSEAGLTGVEPVPTVTAEDIRRMANENRTNERIPDGLSILGAGIAGPYTEFLERMAETPLFPERRGMQFGETPIGSIQSDPTEEPMDETLQRILANSEAAIARESAIGMTPVSTYDEVPFTRAPLPQPDLRDEDRARRTAEYIERNLAADAQRMGLDLSGRIPREAPEILPSIPEDINRARFADIPTGMLPASDRIRFGETPVGALPAGEISGVGSQIRALTRRPVPGMGDDADVAAGSAGRAERRGQGSLDGLFDRESPLDPRAERARAAADEAAAAELEAALLEGPDMGGFLSTPAGSLPAASEAEDREREIPRTDGGGSGTGGGSGAGGGAGGGMSGDDLYDQDKWLALAQFGLSLMSSQAPTFGQALGEAGSTGIAALRQAREDRQDRIEAAQTRADRLAAAAARSSTRGGFTASNLVSRLNSLEGDQRQLLVAISNARNNPEAALLEGGPDVSSLERLFLNNQLELERLRSVLGGAYDVGSEEVFDATGS